MNRLPLPLPPPQRPYRWICAGVAACAAFNAAIGAIPLKGEAAYFAKLGIYAGEYITLAIWCSLGSASHLFRLSTGALVGVVWITAGLLGLFIQFPDRFGQYSGDLRRMLTVAPLALTITMLPLYVLRSWRWGLQLSPPVSLWSSLTVWLMLAATSAAMIGCFVGVRQGGDNLIVTALVGKVLGAYALLVAPSLTLAFLGKQLQVRWVFAAFTLVSALGIALASRSAVPGPGAAPTYLYGPALLFSLSLIAPVLIAFLTWRLAGMRY